MYRFQPLRMSEFSEKLVRIMEARGLTQSALARRTGLRQGYISKLCRGEREPGLAMLITLSRGLGLTVSQLVDGFVDRQLEKEAKEFLVLFESLSDQAKTNLIQYMDFLKRQETRKKRKRKS